MSISAWTRDSRPVKRSIAHPPAMPQGPRNPLINETARSIAEFMAVVSTNSYIDAGLSTWPAADRVDHERDRGLRINHECLEWKARTTQRSGSRSDESRA